VVVESAYALEESPMRIDMCAVGVGGINMACKDDFVCFEMNNLGIGYYSRYCNSSFTSSQQCVVSGDFYVFGDNVSFLFIKKNKKEFGISDRIGVFLELDCHRISFFKNDKLMGMIYKWNSSDFVQEWFQFLK
jgi:hypothetical protein